MAEAWVQGVHDLDLVGVAGDLAGADVPELPRGVDGVDRGGGEAGPQVGPRVSLLVAVAAAHRQVDVRVVGVGEDGPHLLDHLQQGNEYLLTLTMVYP